MAINDLLRRAREYTYDREGLEDFVDELLSHGHDAHDAVADYLAGHGLAIARLHSPQPEPGPWFWLDEFYLDSLALIMDASRSVEVLGVGHFKGQEAVEALRALITHPAP